MAKLRDRSLWRVADIAAAAAAAPVPAGEGGIVVGPGVDLRTHVSLLSSISEEVCETYRNIVLNKQPLCLYDKYFLISLKYIVQYTKEYVIKLTL